MKIFYGRFFRWIGKKRGEFSFIFALIAIILNLFEKTKPVSLLRIDFSGVFIYLWLLILTGIGIRIWAAGNIKKYKEVTIGGPYMIVRHPLYFGTLLIYLSYFLAIGDDKIGIFIFIIMYLTIYYPRMLHEEENLKKHFPESYYSYAYATPRIIPNIFLIPSALKTSRFSIKEARKNIGFRSLWAIITIPLIVEFIRYVENYF